MKRFTFLINVNKDIREHADIEASNIGEAEESLKKKYHVYLGYELYDVTEIPKPLNMVVEGDSILWFYYGSDAVEKKVEHSTKNTITVSGLVFNREHGEQKGTRMSRIRIAPFDTRLKKAIDGRRRQRNQIGILENIDWSSIPDELRVQILSLIDSHVKKDE